MSAPDRPTDQPRPLSPRTFLAQFTAWRNSTGAAPGASAPELPTAFQQAVARTASPAAAGGAGRPAGSAPPGAGIQVPAPSGGPLFSFTFTPFGRSDGSDGGATTPPTMLQGKRKHACVLPSRDENDASPENQSAGSSDEGSAAGMRVKTLRSVGRTARPASTRPLRPASGMGSAAALGAARVHMNSAAVGGAGAGNASLTASAAAGVGVDSEHALLRRACLPAGHQWAIETAQAQLNAVKRQRLM